MSKKTNGNDWEIEYLKSRLLLAEADARNLEAAHRDALAAFERVNGELKAVYASRRWRMTEPFSRLKKWKRPSEAPAEPRRDGLPPPAKENTVLVIDHHIPTPDKDAGSRSTLGYIRLLLEMGYHVVVWGADFAAPEPYAEELRQMGADVLSGPEFSVRWREWVAQSAGQIVAALINRPGVARQFLRFIKENTRAKILYMGHDLHFLRERRGVEAGALDTDAREIEAVRAMEHIAMRDADAVLMFNDEEGVVIREEFGVEAVTVPLFFYDGIPARETGFDQGKDLLFVGGFSHAPNADAALWFANEVLPLVRKELPDARLYIVGSNPPPAVQGLEGGEIAVTGFVSDEKLEAYYRKCRVCVVPLRYGAGVKGKTVEAMYHGIPIVSTSVGIEGMKGIRDVTTPADTREEFAAQVVRKYTDKSAWEAESGAYRQYLEEHMSTEIAKKLMEQALKG